MEPSAAASATQTMQELLGSKLVKGDGSQLDFKTWFDSFKAKAKYIGLYYGAHWAPPSRLYTKDLEAKFYKEVKEDDGTKDLIEVIFVSDDRQEDHFKRNIAKMPWLAIPFDAELVK